MAKILVCDDDKDIVEAIDIYLTQEGYEVLKAYDGDEAIKVLKRNEVDLLIMDVMMPRLDGIRATLKIRENMSLPIIILSAKSEDADKILGLNIGADDYMTKPFNPLELVARVKSQLRRYTQLGSTARSDNQSEFRTGGLVIRDDLKEVTVDGEKVKLTPIEYNILLLLVKNQGKVFSINQIYENIWNEEAIGADNTVAVHIRHIREKIEINPKEPRYLKVVWGVGYKVEKDRLGGLMNNKWYQRAPCKGILIVLEHILAVVMITCLVFTFSYPGDNLAGILFEKPHKKYDQSKGFTDKLMSAANDITAAEGYDSNFETEGKYDENRIVDLKEYDSDRKISNENVNGLAYRLGDFVNYWENDQEMYYADGTKMADGDNDDEIIVCQKDDGTYHYYYEKEFRREFKNGNLQFGNMDEAKDEYSLESTGEVIDSLINDWIENSASIYRNILDSENRQVYTKCWRYDGEKVSENCAPVGAKNLLEVVNKDSRWNGKLSDAMSMLGNTVDSVRDEFLTWQYVTEEYKEGNTNLAYMIVDLDNKKVYTNRLAYQRFDEWEKNLESMKKLGVYAVATPKLTEYQSDIDMDGSQWKSLIGGNMWMDNYECVFAVDTSYPIQDDFYQESKIYQEYAPQVRFTFWIADCNRICNACNSVMADNCCRQIKPGRRHCVKSGR